MSGHSGVLLPEGRARSRSDGPSTLKGRDDIESGNHDQVQGKLDSGSGQGYSGQRYHGSKAWWSVGEFLHQGITHQSVGLSLGRNEEETWDLSDSLADLYQAVTQRQRESPDKLISRGHTRSDSGGAVVGRSESDMLQDIRRWLDEDTNNGYIRVFASDHDSSSRLFPCTLSTSAQKICLQMGIPGNSLHVQLSGDVIRRMEPFDCPLAIQNEYLAGLGYSSIRYIQEEGPSEDLAYLVRFYAGKPLSDFTYSRNQLSTYAYIRKGKLLHQWTRRLCVISGTRLLIYREKGAEPTAVQLARGSVEEVLVKGQSFVLKLTSTLQGERSLYMSFSTTEDYNKWLRKIRKATAKLPGKADLSNCHLEFLPETVFINTELEILILRHNALRERPIEEDIYTIGWLDDLPRFHCLRSLNLADNQLTSFPLSLTNIRSLVELNLASNKLEEVPSQIIELANLQVLHLHNNLLSSLPEEIGQMRNLAVVVLAFNRFAHVPVFLLQSQVINCKVDSVIMAGNQISRLPAEHLGHMSHIKKIDLRLNRLQLLPTETAKFQSLEHVTHMDIRQNQVADLDVRAIRQLEYLNCERNNMRSMQLNGSSLKNVFASHNCLQTLNINPKPEWLVSMDVSHNKLTDLPAWLPDCFFLASLDVSHNSLHALPDRLFTDGRRLKVIKANHNRLMALPEKIRTDTLEELHLQHNMIRHLSGELFLKATRLRYLNVTKNKLCDLPPPNDNDSYNKLQELYLSFNHLANRALEKICCFPRLRILHMARNKLSVIEEIDIEKLEQLSELNVSENNLTYLPAALGRHPKLQVLRANCNLLQELPNFKNSSGLKVLEVSSNHLINVDMSNLMASQVSLLDISANPSILVKSNDLQAAKKRLCMLDMRGQNWSLEDVRGPNQAEDDKGLRWQTGLSQTSGIRNKLSVTTINKPVLSDSSGEALFAVFDGGRNETIANLLCDVVPTTLKEERAKSKDPETYLKYCLLSAHRNLKTKGQKLGASAVVAHLHKDDRGQDVLSVANVGDSQVVLCRQRRACLMSRPFVVAKDVEDTRRVVTAGGIITEDGRVSGVTYNTRLMGCSYLYPHVIPDPQVTSTVLTSDDTAVVVANQGLWQFVSYEEAVREIKDIPDPVVAAKRLQDLAQGYGSRENIAILVVRLMLSEEEKSRIHDLMRVQRKAQKEILKVSNPKENLLLLRDGVPKVEELNEVIIDKYGHAKKGRRGSRKALYPEDGGSSIGSSVIEGLEGSRNHSQTMPSLADSNLNDMNSQNVEHFQHQNSKINEAEQASGSPKQPQYRKKNALNFQASTESMKRRIPDELKARELRNVFNEGSEIKRNEDTTTYGEPQHRDNGEVQSNWVAQKPRDVKRGNNPEEWKELLHHRLNQELVDREIKKMINEKDREENWDEDDSEDGSDGDDHNWATRQKTSKQTSVGLSSEGILKRSITRPAGTSQKDSDSTPTQPSNANMKALTYANSLDSLDSELIGMLGHATKPHSSDNDAIHQFKDFYNYHEQFEEVNSSQNQTEEFDEDFEEDRFSVSPSESVSSIDLRLHNEADEIYRLRYFNPHQSTSDLHSQTGSHNSNVFPEDRQDIAYPPPASFVDSNGGIAEPVKHSSQDVNAARPLSPDSLISQDDFVKPPINTSNIDRDALLFHQMQMARAQAHAGSVASLDSVQSAPMHTTSRKDIFPQARTSSHSIEVLVNIGEGEDGDRQKERDSSSRELGRASSESLRNKWGSNNPSQSGSSSTLTGGSWVDLSAVDSAKNIGDTTSHPSQRSSKEKLRHDQTGMRNKGVPSKGQGDKTSPSIENENDDDDYDDEDRNTLVGDKEGDDIANLEDVEVGQHEDDSINVSKIKGNASLQIQFEGRYGKSAGHRIDKPKPSSSSPPSTDVTYDSNDSDSDESIGNVSLGDGYTAIEFPTNFDRNGSLSMLNVLESESEDYPELFLRVKTNERGANAAHRKTRRGSGNRADKVNLGSNNVFFGSQPKLVRTSQKSLDRPTDEKDDKTLSSSHINVEMDESQTKIHSIDDYEDIEDLKEEGLTQSSETLGTFIEDMSLYEEMEYSPTHTDVSQSSQVELPTSEKPSEEDIDALYAKVNKIKMQKIHRDSTDKADMDSFMLLDDSQRHSLAFESNEPKPPALPPRLTPEGMDAAKDEEDDIFISASDLLPKRPPRPPLPIKPANGFPKLKPLPPSESHANRSQPQHHPTQEHLSQHLQRANANVNPIRSSFQASTPFQVSQSSSEATGKFNNGVHDSVNGESKGNSLKTLNHKPPSPQSLIDPSVYQSKPVQEVSCHQIQTVSSLRKPPSPEFNSTAVNSKLKARPESPGKALLAADQPQTNSRPPPPLPPKKPYLNSNVQPVSQQSASRPRFPLKPQLQSQQEKHQNQRPYHQQPQQQQQRFQQDTLQHRHLQQPNSQSSNKNNPQPHQVSSPHHTYPPERDFQQEKKVVPPAPKPRNSKKSSHPPLAPHRSSDSTQPARLTQPLPFRNPHIPSDRTILPPGGTHIAFPHVEENGDDEFDNSVLSAHELYPDSHYPSSSYLPSSAQYPVGTSHLPSTADLAAAASRLPTQRSIIITYL